MHSFFQNIIPFLQTYQIIVRQLFLSTIKRCLRQAQMANEWMCIKPYQYLPILTEYLDSQIDTFAGNGLSDKSILYEIFLWLCVSDKATENGVVYPIHTLGMH